MTRWYIDSSAAVKLLVEAEESDLLVQELDSARPDLVSCFLLETELRRVVHRRAELDHAAVTSVLDRVSLYEVPPSIFREAGLLPSTSLRSLDAVHLAAAVRLGVDAVLTYDDRMKEAAHGLGLVVAAPGS